MDSDSVWLGPLRGPMRLLMIGFCIITALLYAYLVVSRLFVTESIGMHEMIRPSGRPVVYLMLFCLFGTLMSASLYLSDFIGAIEVRPRGFFDILSLVTSRMAMILTGIVVLVMFYEVVSRYVFLRPTLWANELSLWIAAFIYLFAGQYAMQQRSHIRIYVIYDLLSRGMKKACDVITVLLIVGFAVALVWGGWDDAMRRLMRMETFGTAWDPPIPGTVKMAILVIIILVAIQSVSNLIADWDEEPESHGYDDVDEVEIENIRRTLEK